MLLEVDGLHKEWNNGVASDWETEHDNYESLPFAMKRLWQPGTERKYDISGMGYGNDVERSQIISEIEIPAVREMVDRQFRNPEEILAVKDLPLSVVRQKLIRHFNIAFHKKEIKWPQRMREKKVDAILLKEQMNIGLTSSEYK